MTETPGQYRIEPPEPEPPDTLAPKLKGLDNFANSCDRKLLSMIKILELGCEYPVIDIPSDSAQARELQELVGVLKKASDFARDMKHGILTKLNLQDDKEIYNNKKCT